MTTPAQDGTPAPVPLTGARPRVAVVVTNYNYGHFLPACLDSVAKQSEPADEVVVVDDGSSDNSLDVLRDRPGIRVVAKANGGQASAFNAGFAATTAEVVLFLDADDLLLPDALWTIRRLWSPALSGLSYGLEMTGVADESLGVYPYVVHPGDQRPRILRSLSPWFMPTSGNAFTRDRVAWAFPLPVEGWRICTDALLVRAAMLSAPMRHVPHVLGRYRVHGQNNYFMEGERPDWRVADDMMVQAASGVDLVWLTDRAGRTLPAEERYALLRKAAASALMAQDRGRGTGDAAALLSRVRGLWPARRGLGAAVVLSTAAHAGTRSAWLRRQLAPGAVRPDAIGAAERWLIGRTLWQGMDRAMAQHPAPAVMPVGRDIPSHELGAFCSGPGWQDWPRGVTLCMTAPEATIRFIRNRAGEAVLTLACAPCDECTGADVTIAHNGRTVARAQLSAEADEITVPLPALPSVGCTADIVTLAVRRPGRTLRARLAQPLSTADRLCLSSLRLTYAAKVPEPIVLPVGRTVPAATAGLSCGPDGVAALAPDEPLILTDPGLVRGLCLSIELPQDHASGELVLLAGGDELFAGRALPGGILRIPVPGSFRGFGQHLSIVALLQPDDPLAEPHLRLARLGWIPGPPTPAGDSAPFVAPGAWLAAEALSRSGVLASGWQADEDGPLMTGAEASLSLAFWPDGEGGTPVLGLDLSVVAPLPRGTALVVAATAGEQVLHMAEFLGDGVFEVPLDPAAVPPGETARIVLHAVLRPREPGSGEAAALSHGGIRLRSLGLPGRSAKARASPLGRATPSDSSLPLRALLDRSVNWPMLADAERADIRAALATAIIGLSPQGALALLTARDIRRLTRLGQLTDRRVPPPDWPRTAGKDAPGRWLRWLALAALGGSADALDLPPLTAFPDCTPELTAALAAWLVSGAAEPPASPDRDARLAGRLTEARELILGFPAGHPKHLLGREMIAAMPGDPRQRRGATVARAFEAALESALLSEGNALTLPARGRLPDMQGDDGRVALLVRSARPGRVTAAAAGLARALERRGRPVDIVATDDAAAARPARALGGFGVGTAVAELRRTGYATVILADACMEGGRYAEIAAHRLAPRQVALPAFNPNGCGFASADSTDEACNARPGLTYAFGAAAPAPDFRKRHGLAVGARVVAGRIGPAQPGAEALAALAGLLSADGATALVLVTPSAEPGPRERDVADDIVRRAGLAGMAGTRLKVYAALADPEFEALLAAADLYLDGITGSNPFTVAQALAAGCPCLAAAIEADSEDVAEARHWIGAAGLPAEPAAAETLAGRIAAASIPPGDRRRADLAARMRAVLDDPAAGGALAALGVQDRDEAGKEYRYLFNHIPKTGGSSLREVFAQWFPLTEDYPEPWATEPGPRADLSAVPPGGMLCGHFHPHVIRLDDRYPETRSPEWRRIVFLRDPLQTALSLHFYANREGVLHDPIFAPRVLDTFITSMNGLLIPYLGCTAATWQETIDGYWFVGTLERADECLDWLARALCKPPPGPLPLTNVTPRDETPSPEAEAAFRRNAAAEFAMYDYVNRRLDRLFASPLPPGLQHPAQERTKGRRRGRGTSQGIGLQPGGSPD